MTLMCHTVILWSAHCDMWSAQSSRFSIAVCVSSELSKCASQSVSFLYIVVLHQLWLVELSRFQYYFDCDHTFNLFSCIEVYICKVSLFLSQLTSELCLWLIELYSLCHEVKNSFINFLHNMSRDLLHLFKMFSSYMNYLTWLYLIMKISLLQSFKKHCAHDSELKHDSQQHFILKQMIRWKTQIWLWNNICKCTVHICKMIERNDFLLLNLL